jgi:hypothetical protein
MTDERRSPSVLKAGILLTALVLVYVLAEAPLFRLTGNPLPYGGVWVLWKPVDWLADHTALDRPLQVWWRLWGREESYTLAQSIRSDGWRSYPLIVD